MLERAKQCFPYGESKHPAELQGRVGDTMANLVEGGQHWTPAWYYYEIQGDPVFMAQRLAWSDVACHACADHGHCNPTMHKTMAISVMRSYLQKVHSNDITYIVKVQGRP
jgi:hypothetical protein